jgi:hypothetical protein
VDGVTWRPARDAIKSVTGCDCQDPNRPDAYMQCAIQILQPNTIYAASANRSTTIYCSFYDTIFFLDWAGMRDEPSGYLAMPGQLHNFTLYQLNSQGMMAGTGIEQLRAKYTYTDYITQCAPSSCYWSEEANITPLDILIYVSGLLGGLTVALKYLTTGLLVIWRKCSADPAASASAGGGGKSSSSAASPLGKKKSNPRAVASIDQGEENAPASNGTVDDFGADVEMQSVGP